MLYKIKGYNVVWDMIMFIFLKGLSHIISHLQTHKQYKKVHYMANPSLGGTIKNVTPFNFQTT
jgi:hypothetical protein